LFFLLYPARELLAELGPQVGIQRSVPLISFINADVVAAISLFWFLQEGRRSSMVFAGLSVIVLLMAQTRGQYLAVVLTLAAGTSLYIVARRTHTRAEGTRVLARVAVAIPVALLALTFLPPITGRLGEVVGPDVVITQLGTLAGGEGPGSGSLEHRAEAWPQVVHIALSAPMGWLTGVGYGPDLFGGFEIAGGVEVRKPHNDLLEIWARTGLVGFLPWFSLVLCLGVWAIRHTTSHRFGWFLLALQTSMLLSALTQPSFAFAYRGMVYMLLMGLIIGAAITLDRDHGSRLPLQHI
jgi:O-antigen ligase